VRRLARQYDRLSFLGSSGTGTLVGRSLDVVVRELALAQQDLHDLYGERRRLQRAAEALRALAEAKRARQRRTRLAIPYPEVVSMGERLLFRVEAEQEVEAELEDDPGLTTHPGWLDATPA